MELVVFAGKDKENWGQISALLNRGQWDKIVVVRGKEAENFPKNWNFDEVVIDTGKPLEEMKSELMGKLKQKIGMEFEVALSIASGNGKEHMALISALLSIPVGIRLVVYSKKGIEFVN